MTPYELRFEIFKEAKEIASSQFYAEFELAERRNEDSDVNYPEFPSYEKIESLANKINDFVSTK